MSDAARDVLVQTLETVSTAAWGELTRLKVYTPDYRPLSWLAVWRAFAEIYPGRWALELYPPPATSSTTPTSTISGCCQRGMPRPAP